MDSDIWSRPATLQDKVRNPGVEFVLSARVHIVSMSEEGIRLMYMGELSPPLLPDQVFVVELPIGMRVTPA